MPTIIARTATLPQIATLALICDEPWNGPHLCPWQGRLGPEDPKRQTTAKGVYAFANYGNEAAADPRPRLENYRDLSRLGQKPKPENRSLGVVHDRNLPEGIDG